MQSLLIGGRRGVAAAARAIAIIAAMLVSGLSGAGGAAADDTRGAAWDSYARASEAYTNCRFRGRTLALCKAEKEASKAAEARYRAAIGAASPTGH